MWLTAAQAREVLGVTRRTLARYVDAERISVRINPARGARGLLYASDHVEAIRAERAEQSAVDRPGRKRASERALWALKELYPTDYARLRLAELEKERGSPASPGNPPHQPPTVQKEGAR